MVAPEELIREYVEATSSGDEDAAAALVADDLLIELPDGGALKGTEGARQFAAKHAEIDGRKQSVELTALEARPADRFVATLKMTSREVPTGEVLFSMDVGGVFEVRDGLIVRSQVFPSPEEAAAAE
jgi:ketosteroid isomerase-like protein